MLTKKNNFFCHSYLVYWLYVVRIKLLFKINWIFLLSVINQVKKLQKKLLFRVTGFNSLLWGGVQKEGKTSEAQIKLENTPILLFFRGLQANENWQPLSSRSVLHNNVKHLCRWGWKHRQTWSKATNPHELGIIWVAGVLTNKPTICDEATHQCSRAAAQPWGRSRGRRAAAPGTTQRGRSSPDVPQSAGWHYWTQSGTRSALLRDTEGQKDVVRHCSKSFLHLPSLIRNFHLFVWNVLYVHFYYYYCQGIKQDPLITFNNKFIL